MAIECQTEISQACFVALLGFAFVCEVIFIYLFYSDCQFSLSL